MEITKELKDQLQVICDKKTSGVNEQDFEKACLWREIEVEFILEHFKINVRHEKYSIHGNEIIF